MSVETFTKAQFEAALPKDKATGLPLWRHMGFIQGEHVYAIDAAPRTHILIRSSIDDSGLSAPSGEDSIRLWLAEIGSERPLMGKITRWVTRVPGWQERLTEQARRLYKVSRQLKQHSCGALPIIRRTKQKRDDGRVYYKKCDACDKFIEWVEID